MARTPWAEYVAWLDRETAAGRDPEPEPWDLAEAWNPAAAPRFGQGGEADVLPPGPLLAGLTEAAVRDFGALSDSELTGVLLAAGRQQVREAYKQVLAIAEFGRRRQAAFEDAKGRGVPAGCRPGGFPGEELAMELVTTRAAAEHRIENALDLTTRLPATLAGMAAGLIDEDRAAYIAYYTRSLEPGDAARADEILAAAAPDLRVDQLARKAAALEMKLAPEAARARKEHEKQAGQRVEARREYSGNASLAAREMDTADAIASKSYIDAMAARLRNGGLDAPLGMLRVLAMTDLTQGRNPLDRLGPAATPDPSATADPAGVGPAPGTRSNGPGRDGPTADGPGGQPGRDAGEAANPRRDDPPADEPEETDEPEQSIRRRPLRRTDPAPPPALISLLVPAGTILGTSTAPAQAGTWGLLDHEETRAIVEAASRHPRTRWCVTLVSDKGEAARPRLRPRPAPPPARRPGTAAPAGPAGGAPPPPEPHLQTHRQGPLRPRARRRPLHPQPQPQAPGPRPHRHLRRPRLRLPGRPRRPGPHRALPRRPHLRVQPRPEMPNPPPLQASPRLESRAARARRHPLDPPVRPHPHHHPHPLRPLNVPKTVPAWDCTTSTCAKGNRGVADQELRSPRGGQRSWPSLTPARFRGWAWRGLVRSARCGSS